MKTLCFDKTGTLTEKEMSLEEVYKFQEQSGKFEIVDKSLQEGFWSPFTPPYQYELAKENIDFSNVLTVENYTLSNRNMRFKVLEK